MLSGLLATAPGVIARDADVRLRASETGPWTLRIGEDRSLRVWPATLPAPVQLAGGLCVKAARVRLCPPCLDGVTGPPTPSCPGELTRIQTPAGTPTTES